VNAKQLAALSAWQREHNAKGAPSAELVALSELLALIEVLIDLGLIDGSRDATTHQWLSLTVSERRAQTAFLDAIEKGNELVAAHFRARAGL
jgi:hypothetical protein